MTVNRESYLPLHSMVSGVLFGKNVELSPRTTWKSHRNPIEIKHPILLLDKNIEKLPTTSSDSLLKLLLIIPIPLQFDLTGYKTEER